MLRLRTPFAWRAALVLVELFSRPALAEANEAAIPRLQVVGSCPTAEAVERALAPLVRRDFAFSAEAVPRVVDHGARFAVSVKGQTGQYLDAQRDCAERARVSAVFIAMTLNPPQIRSSEGAAPAPEASPPEASALQPPTRPVASALAIEAKADATRAGSAWAHLEVGARFDGAVGVGSPSNLAAGVEARASLGAGRFGGVLGAAALAPVIWEFSGVLVREQRFPGHLALRLRWPSAPAELSLDLGVSTTLFVMRAPELSAGELVTRLDVGPRAALLARFETARGLSPYLGAQFEYFPRTYRLHAEPVGQLSTTPQVWVGMNLGVSLSLN